jgi:hypothetical protein
LSYIPETFPLAVALRAFVDRLGPAEGAHGVIRVGRNRAGWDVKQCIRRAQNRVGVHVVTGSAIEIDRIAITARLSDRIARYRCSGRVYPDSSGCRLGVKDAAVVDRVRGYRRTGRRDSPKLGAGDRVLGDRARAATYAPHKPGRNQIAGYRGSRSGAGLNSFQGCTKTREAGL